MLRTAYPDELPRIKSIMQGAQTPPHAEYLVFIKEHPVERIIAVFPWWINAPAENSESSVGAKQSAEFSMHLAGATQLSKEKLAQAISSIEKKASDQADELRYQGSMLEACPMFSQLTAQGFSIMQTDKHFLIPGESMKQRSIRFYQKFNHKIPQDWKIESIRGHKPEEIWSVIAEHGLMAPHAFKHYWDGASREHFEEDYSSVIIAESKIIVTFLITKRSDTELHVHIDAVTKSHSSQSNLATMMMRNFFAERCPAGFPEHFSSRADETKHKQTQNTALRFGGKELTPQHLLAKLLDKEE